MYNNAQLILTCNMHFIRSPGAIIVVVRIPEKPPAAANCRAFRSFEPVPEMSLTSCLPQSKPKKLKAKMGAVPTKGAPIPGIRNQI